MKAIEILNKLNKAEHWEDYYPSKMQCNEAIAELEALENRSCESCKWFDEHSEVCYEPIQNRLNSSSYICIDNKDFCCNRWESKC